MRTESVPGSRYWVFAAVLVAGLAADLWTKHVMFSWPALDRDIYWLWPEYAGFQRALNEGALFGLGQGMVPLFAAISVLALVAIGCWLFLYKAARDWTTCIALAAISAGVLGNLYDRMGLPGLDWQVLDAARSGEPVYAVRDWILLQLGNDWRWPNFNLADSLLVCGAIAAAARSLFEPEQQTAS